MYYCEISILIFISSGGIFECFHLRCTEASIEADKSRIMAIGLLCGTFTLQIVDFYTNLGFFCEKLPYVKSKH